MASPHVQAGAFKVHLSSIVRNCREPLPDRRHVIPGQVPLLVADARSSPEAVPLSLL